MAGVQSARVAGTLQLVIPSRGALLATEIRAGSVAILAALQPLQAGSAIDRYQCDLSCRYVGHVLKLGMRAGADATLAALETLQAGPAMEGGLVPPRVSAPVGMVRLVELERRSLPQPPLKQVSLVQAACPAGQCHGSLSTGRSCASAGEAPCGDIQWELCPLVIA